jgi:hypothetical protein
VDLKLTLYIAVYIRAEIVLSIVLKKVILLLHVCIRAKLMHTKFILVNYVQTSKKKIFFLDDPRDGQ